jgi:hypothetical protein
MRLGVSKDVLYKELDMAMAILAKWQKQLEKGVPAVDVPGREEALHDWLREFYGEIMLVSDKCSTVATRLLETAE